MGPPQFGGGWPNKNNQRFTKNSSLLVKSNNPFGGQQPMMDNSYNFDINSNKSPNFLNDEDRNKFEEIYQDKVQEVWTKIELKQETLQKEYQGTLE